MFNKLRNFFTRAKTYTYHSGHRVTYTAFLKSLSFPDGVYVGCLSTGARIPIKKVGYHSVCSHFHY